jgi:hypothetical protein
VRRELAPIIVSILAVVVFAGFVGLLFTKTIADGMKEALLILAGSASTGYGMVLSYYLGSSAGSNRKDDTISKLTDKQ